MYQTRYIVISVAIMLLHAAAFGQSTSGRDKGIELYRSGKYAEAGVVLEKLLTEQKSDAPAVMYLAAAYVRTGEHDRAVSTLKELKNLRAAPTPLSYEKKIKYLVKPQPQFSPAGRPLGMSGSIKVLAEFKADGTVGFVFPYAMTSPKLIEGAVNAAKGIKFEPAVAGGKAVDVVTLLEYTISSY